MITSDFHLHSSFSTDSEEPMEKIIHHAIDIGLTNICFTEHMDLDFPKEISSDENMFVVDLEAYRRSYLDMKTKYKDQINLSFGLELGLQPQIVKENEVISESYPFDFIIASSHLCHGRDPYYPSFYEGRSERKAYMEYFESILENLELFHNFDVYGHLDYVVRYGPNQNKDYSYQAYSDILDAILQKIISLEKGIECNTGGLAPKYHLGATNPCFDILKRYRELGGENITVGSDAHNADFMAYGFDLASQALLNAGFRYYCTYQNRVPSYHKI